MKLRSFQIQNYKCLKNINQKNCGNFLTLIGANSSGKSSIFKAINFVKNLNSSIKSKEIAYGGVEEYETKIIQLNMQIEISDDLRKTYLHHFFNLEEELAEHFLETSALKLINLKLEIKVFGEKAPTPNNNLNIILTGIEILTDTNDFFTFLAKTPEEQLHARLYKSNNKKTNLNNTTLTQYLESIGVTVIQPGTDNHLHPSMFLGRFIADLNESLRELQPIRESQKTVPYQFIDNATQLGQRGENLANFMDTMYTNKRERYYEVEKYCKAIFPNIESIRPEKLPNQNIRIIVIKKNLPHAISMEEEGRGIDQLLILIWNIATSQKGTIWLLDEPEIHLHPGAEKLLYDFLQDETERDKQIIVATHSMVFIHKSNENEISILLNKDGSTELTSLEDLLSAGGEDQNFTNAQTRSHVYEALGYDSTLALEPASIVVVEGKTDEKIFQIFSNIIDKPINQRSTKFIPVGDKRQAEQFTPILTYAASNKNVLIILDNDKETPEQIKQKVLQREENYRQKIGISYHLLDDDSFGVYREEAYSIEYYLLDPKAIVKVVNAPDKLELIRSQIKTELAKPLDQQMKPKDFLKQIWSDNGFGPYDEAETPLKIAKNTSKDYLLGFPEIVKIIEKINS